MPALAVAKPEFRAALHLIVLEPRGERRTPGLAHSLPRLDSPHHASASPPHQRPIQPSSQNPRLGLENDAPSVQQRDEEQV